ncbi:MAG: 2-oxoacid:acceptor oxidoreductase subunit alpha [Candidatus Kerfeldbacteria bacterium]|nr:2-oxoacid:acceptor oxidoreductase subunit alpha [Candidatus Kerfeldbacteria bacterium]
MKPIANELTWKIGGEAGFGIMSTGEMFAKTCIRAGLYVIDYPEYPSLIRGGHNTDQVTVSAKPLWSHRRPVNILVALNRETIDRHVNELTPNGVIVYDSTDISFTGFNPMDVDRRDVHIISLPLEDLARAAGGQKLMRNTVALGATFGLLRLDLNLPRAVVSDTFSAKGEAIVKLNLGVLQAGYDAITARQADLFPWDIVLQKSAPARMLVTGNDALAIGALQAGCQFYAAYPMTPASSLLHFLAEHGPAEGLVVRHSEDEIAAINQTIGAAYTGVRAMCGTAGGGFSLMTEAVGLAGMTEVGLVIIEAQRGGPSTGLPTWTEQGDLRQVLHASQGDFLKIVMAPTTPTECVTMIQQAFNLADRYQTPVIVMTDKYLAEMHAAVDLPIPKIPIDRGLIASASELKKETAFRRYRIDSTDGVSPRTLPGTADGLFLANSDEHDEFGFSNEDADIRLGQMDRRERKRQTLAASLPTPELIGPGKADLTIVTWGSSYGPVREAVQQLADQRIATCNILPITFINPLPPGLGERLRACTQTIMVEANQSGQLAGWIKEQTGHDFDHHIRRYDGRPFDPDELVTELQAIMH